MSYSDWQLNRVRDALRAYHRYERGIEESGAFTWKDVSEAIDEYTDVRIPPERLRQFVEGVKNKKGVRNCPIPQDRSLESIVSFVTHDDLGLLSKDELKHFVPSHQAALRLLEYLNQDLDRERMRPPDGLRGMYQVKKSYDGGFVNRELTLERASEMGLIQVTETEDFYDMEAVHHWDQWSLQERRRARNSHVKHGGWAIITPENNLLFFLKKERNGMNRYYLTIAVEQSVWASPRQMWLILLQHNVTLGLSEYITDSRANFELAKERIEENLIYLNKIR